MYELMLWVSGHAMQRPRTLMTYNRIAGKRADASPMLFVLMIGWPMFVSAAS
ncbi:MAG: hypothetical protein RQ867_08805 [Mariprofundaceae bacterium]|nr:hypothetical protein [Mariprofundaceae bacterium]